MHQIWTLTRPCWPHACPIAWTVRKMLVMGRFIWYHIFKISICPQNVPYMSANLVIAGQTSYGQTLHKSGRDQRVISVDALYHIWYMTANFELFFARFVWQWWVFSCELIWSQKCLHANNFNAISNKKVRSMVRSTSKFFVILMTVNQATWTVTLFR